MCSSNARDPGFSARSYLRKICPTRTGVDLLSGRVGEFPQPNSNARTCARQPQYQRFWLTRAALYYNKPCGAMIFMRGFENHVQVNYLPINKKSFMAIDCNEPANMGVLP